MPKRIEKLTNVEVLKGFVIGSSSKSSYQISDLADLKNLERLSIHIGSGAIIDENEFESLKGLSKLEHLIISWGVCGTRYTDDIRISLLSNLKKLHLDEDFPEESIPRLLKPTNLPVSLKDLNLAGGKLASMDHGKLDHSDSCKLEIIRLKYLKHLIVDPEKLQTLFPSSVYVEIKDLQNLLYHEWIKDEER
ncbi:Disease resistance RPP13-like protein 4 [Glycine soja]|nr:hypothetical protein JHK87_022973 [Glycine soja]KAH1239415.1 Disease resistance RPP13-like protein 4 [Glycine max]